MGDGGGGLNWHRGKLLVHGNGSAEAEGDAFTILTADELDYAKSVEVYVGHSIARKKLDDFPYTYTAMLDEDPIRQIRRKSSGPRKRR
jgi:ATP-dependent RNA helicase RhlE